MINTLETYVPISNENFIYIYIILEKKSFFSIKKIIMKKLHYNFAVMLGGQGFKTGS